MEEQMTKDDEHIDFPTTIKWHLQQERMHTLEETIHNDTMPCPIGGINTKTQDKKMEKAHTSMNA